jgi:hypothetical protein
MVAPSGGEGMQLETAIQPAAFAGCHLDSCVDVWRAVGI